MRRNRGRLLVLTLLLALALYLFVDHREAAANEARLGAIASEIAGRPVQVRCQGRFSAAFDVTAESGTVQFDASGRPSDWTDLKRGICTSLARFGSNRDDDKFSCVHDPLGCDMEVLRSIHALDTLAHEAWHLAGHADEATAECYAMQRIAFVAAALGAPPEQGAQLASAAYAVLYPQMPEPYRSAECRDGGSLDLTPESSVFP